jgi:hypothetical protein
MAVLAMLPGEARAQAGRSWVWSFDADAVEKPPRGFSFARTGGGRRGRWIVRVEKEAPSSPNVLAQIDEDPKSYRFPIAVAERPKLRDLALSVRCRAISGNVDQACGLVFRFRNARHYYVARANALENNVRLYRVVRGRRWQIAGWDGRVPGGRWNALRVQAERERITVWWNGERVIEARDRTFRRAGRVGLWTKADSVTCFDDLRAERLSVP